jgi:hypothetical protein
MIIPLTSCVIRHLLHINVIFGNHSDNIIYTVSLTNTVETHYFGYIPFDLTEKYC